MLIPAGIGTYCRADLPQVVLRNLYVEKTPLEPNDIAFLPRPSLAPSYAIGAGPGRGILQRSGFLDGAIYAVSAGTLYKDAASVGTIPGTNDVAMAAALNVLLLANGDALYTSDGMSVSTISFPDDAGVTDVSYLGGYAIAARADSRRIYFTLDPSKWDGLDYVAAEQGNDSLVGFAIVSGQLWAFLEAHTEIFTLTGDADAPLQVVEGRVFDKGALSRASIVPLDNTVFWVGNDGIVYRGAGTPQRVSDHGIEERIKETDAAAIRAWAFPWNGHLFYVLHTLTGTFAYDVATQQWTEFASYGRSRWRARFGLLIGRNVVAMDDETGQIWSLADGAYSDNGAVLERVCTVMIDDPGFIDNLTVDASTISGGIDGVAMEMRTSRDQGRTWRAWAQSRTRRNNARRRVTFNRVGMSDTQGLMIQLRTTDPIASTIRTIKVNEGQGGRSR